MADLVFPVNQLTDADKLLLIGGGTALLEQIGLDVVREVILNVLIGNNLRDAIEPLTRRRNTALNLALASLFLNGTASMPDFVEQLPNLATTILEKRRVPKVEQWVSRWMLGLTGKATQNILRDKGELLQQYKEDYIATCHAVVEDHILRHGDLAGTLIHNSNEISINWYFLAYLLNTVGSETLTIRGSDKSSYGKLFEKLILGTLLHIMDFRYTPVSNVEGELEGCYWLSSRGAKRESDATLIYEVGKGIRFDIGFIGRGNSVITLDKVTRFERQIILGNSSHLIKTIIIVDRIGPKSDLPRIAKEIGGHVVQMSGAYWPRMVAGILRDDYGFDHELLHVSDDKLEEYLKRKIADAPIARFINPPQKENLRTQRKKKT